MPFCRLDQFPLFEFRQVCAIVGETTSASEEKRYAWADKSTRSNVDKTPCFPLRGSLHLRRSKHSQRFRSAELVKLHNCLQRGDAVDLVEIEQPEGTDDAQGFGRIVIVFICCVTLYCSEEYALNSGDE